MAADKLDQKVMHIGLFGCGVVGSAVYAMLTKNARIIRSQTKVDVVVKRIVVRDLRKPRPVPTELLDTDPASILDDPEIDVVVEVMGGMHPARDYLSAALQRGKSVVTANKEVIADCGPELFELAENAGSDLLFEASVGGGIPVLRPLKESLAAGRIRRIMGIVNGTTNYILSQMSESGASFAAALAEAQAKGYAEADPTADVEGYDAARKLAILASIAFQSAVDTGHVQCEGITAITPADIAYGRQRGWALKLIALAEVVGEELEARVQPCFIPAGHPLAGVGDAFNAIYVYGDEVGETMFYGRGAGGMPTASAVVGDIVEAVRNRRMAVSFSEGHFHRRLQPRPAAAASGRYYLRVALTADAPTGASARRRLAAVGAAPWPESGLAEAAPLAGPPGLEHALAVLGIPVERMVQLSGADGSTLVVETGSTDAASVDRLKQVLHEVPGIRKIEGAIRLLTDLG